jgi:hypothetical protein
MTQNSNLEMHFFPFEDVAMLEELAFLVEVPISALQHMPHAIHTLLPLVDVSPESSHRKQVQSQLSPSKMKECEDIGFWSRLNCSDGMECNSQICQG